MVERRAFVDVWNSKAIASEFLSEGPELNSWPGQEHCREVATWDRSRKKVKGILEKINTFQSCNTKLVG